MRSQAKGRLSRSAELEVAIGLPLRNRETLTNFLQQLYDPASPRYRQFLKPAEFAAQFGPSERDYQAVIAFARANHLRVTGLHPNRLMLDVAGSAADLEQAFQIRLSVYQHPTEARTFYAPEVEPSVLESLAVLDISGLDNYRVLQPMALHAVPLTASAGLTPNLGSGPLGIYRGQDFRAAYAPDVTLTGAGQVVGIVAFDGYYPTDIRLYERQSKLAHVPLQNVVLGRLSSTPGQSNLEVATDIEMAISMAPGLSKVVVYQAPNSPKYYNDVLNRMATDNVAKQLSSSWGMHSSPNATSDQIFQQFAAQGQSFFQASGDWGAYAGPVLQPTDNPYITIVGGTTLSTAWSGGPWGAETTWKYNRNFGSGGGISTFYSIPTWQLGLDISASQGSTTMRTLPDVAMVADNIGVICNNGRQYKVAGTSAAAPLWAGFMALVNEQAANCNLPPIGFANPALYAIARGAGYSSSFHDIVAGNNTTSKNPNRFYAVPGYDLCTGWGTPIGQRLIDSLTFGGSALSVIPASGLTLTGKVGGPFDETAASFSLTDSGWEPVSWSSGTDAAWLELTPAAGTLNPDGSTTVATVSLNAAASNLLAGTYTANLWFTNLANGTAQNRALTLQVVPDGSLEVTINPPEAATAGAMWQVDGGPWQASGATVAGLTEGSHVVTFWPLWGWQSPGSQQVTLSRNQAATATGTYVQQFGSLRITLGPAAVVQAGVRWQVDGGPWLESGATVAGLAFGYHTVTFSPINGWKVPTMYSAYTGLGLTALMATYTPVSYGSLQVHLYPTNAPGVEARWQVDGGPWQESGATVACTVGVGHTVTFSSAEGWLPPSAQTVALTANGLTALTGVYAEPYSFTTIAGQTAYIGSDDGPGDTSRFYYPSGIAVDNSGNVFVTDRDNATIRHLRWTKTNWTVSTIAGLANSYDHLDGTNQGARFRSPSGITLDTNGTVYVADSGNYTVRRLSLQGTNWVVSTIAGLAGSWGNVDGPGSEARFGRLAGLTADRNGNLYVADSANYTIRKLTLEGTQWKVTSIAGKGFYGVADGIGTNAGFGDLRGISADGKGHLFVLDHGVMGIRQLTQTGADWVVTSVAGTPFQANPQDGFGPQASFNYPQGLGIDAQGNLYIGEYGAIRKVSPVGADWLVSTIGGPRGTSVDGVNKDAGFTLPMALATDAAGRVFVTDTSSHTIRLGTLAQAGALRVTLTPEEAAKAWAQWRVDGGAWHPSGDISYLPPGEHTLSFSTVFGWATPADQTVTITSNQTTTATGQYLPATTSLQVTLAPAAAVSAGARWQLNGGPWQESGTTLSGLAASYHFITFSSLDGWTTPTSQMVYVTANEAMTVTGTYIQHAGSLQVTLNPPGAVKLGAQWQVDGGPWQSNRAEIAGLAVGNHTVTFKDIPQWNTPVSLLMSIGKDSTNVTAGTYTPWETTSPTLTIITPADQRWNYPELTATGKASDNVAVATVWYQLNGSAWAVANGTSNWAANVELMPGTNTLRAYAVDTSDNKSATNSVRAVYAPSAPLVVRISGSGSVSPNYKGGMLEAGKTYTITAAPDSGFVFGNWTGGLCSTSPKLSFVMESNLVLEANFIPNPFLVAKGTYSGLFALPTERRQESSGSLNLVLTDRGAYSGSCLLGGKAYALSGLFDVAGTASNTIVRAGSPALVMSLALDLTPEANQMTGYLIGKQWVAELTAHRAVYDGLKYGAPAAGHYTLTLPGCTTADGSVFIGDGYGVVTVSASGQVTLSGALADGTPLSQSASLSKDGQWPLYVSLYGGKGSLWGWLSFEPNHSPDGLRGALSWIRPAQPGAGLYPAGFTNAILAEGSRYIPPVSRTNRVIALTEGSLSLEGGNLRQPSTNLLQLTPDNRVINASSNKLSLTLLLQNGLFSGSVTAPGTAQGLAFRGALLQNLNAGYGYFLGTNQSGRVFLGSQ